jgi:hypothetical protein
VLCAGAAVLAGCKVIEVKGAVRRSSSAGRLQGDGGEGCCAQEQQCWQVARCEAMENSPGTRCSPRLVEVHCCSGAEGVADLGAVNATVLEHLANVLVLLLVRRRR